MFGKSGRGSGKKLIRLDDGTSLLCEMDEFDNILPDTCEPLISEGHANTENLEYPKPKITRKAL